MFRNCESLNVRAIDFLGRISRTKNLFSYYTLSKFIEYGVTNVTGYKMHFPLFINAFLNCDMNPFF